VTTRKIQAETSLENSVADLKHRVSRYLGEGKSMLKIIRDHIRRGLPKRLMNWGKKGEQSEYNVRVVDQVEIEPSGRCR